MCKEGDGNHKISMGQWWCTLPGGGRYRSAGVLLDKQGQEKSEEPLWLQQVC